MKIPVPASGSARMPRIVLWQWVWLGVALLYAWPIASNAYEHLLKVNQTARARLIEQHRLWELQSDFQGKPENWTRVASRLLNDSQLLARVARKYGALSEQIELDYRRDLAISRAEVALTWFALWAAPVAASYVVLLLARRRRPVSALSPMPPPASLSDARYRRSADD